MPAYLVSISLGRNGEQLGFKKKKKQKKKREKKKKKKKKSDGEAEF